MAEAVDDCSEDELEVCCSLDEDELEAVGLTDSVCGPELEAADGDEAERLSCWLELELESVGNDSKEENGEAVLDELLWSDVFCGELVLLCWLLEEVVVVKSEVLSSDVLESEVEVRDSRGVVAGLLELVKTWRLMFRGIINLGSSCPGPYGAGAAAAMVVIGPL